MIALNKKSILATALLGSLMVASSAMAGIANTKHNLGSSGTGPNNTDATGEICVFCHTPHGSEAGVKAPLWNKKVSTTSSYTTYATMNSSSIDGGITDVGSVSIACLSCHDGTQAMDVMVNSPGTGTVVDADNAGLSDKTAGSTVTGNMIIGTVGNGIANLGADISNDHPVGIQYAGGGITNSQTVMNDGDFKAPTKKIINSVPVWWVNTTAAGSTSGREKTDMMLYTRTDLSTDTVAQPFVECASCHDPHSDVNKTFLRISNDGSQVCLACHTK